MVLKHWEVIFTTKNEDIFFSIPLPHNGCKGGAFIYRSEDVWKGEYNKSIIYQVKEETDGKKR
jgi:hypothetical protein